MNEVDALIKDMKKSFGDGAASGAIDNIQVQRCPSGVFSFDYATGGGFPQGRTTELYGGEGSGKTNLLMKGIATAQKLQPDYKPAIIDLEGTITPDWAKHMGVKVDNVAYFRPAYGEAAVEMLEKLVEARGVSLIGFDSIGMMTSATELAKDVEGENPGVAARLGKKIAFRIPNAFTRAESRIKQGERTEGLPAVCMINQTRTKIGVTHGDPETTPGGQALKFMHALRVRIYGKGIIDPKINSSLPIYRETTFGIKKFKVPVLAVSGEYKIVAMPFKTFRPGDILDWNTMEAMMKESGLLKKTDEKKGGWTMMGADYKLLTDCRDRYYDDAQMRDMLHRAFIEEELERQFDNDELMVNSDAIAEAA